MYHIGSPTKRRHKVRRVLVTLAVLLLVGGGIATARALQSDTSIQQAAAKTTHVSIVTPDRKVVVKPGFQFSIPTDWKEITAASAYTKYSWQGTGKDDNARTLDIYVDNLPTTLSVNRLLPVQAEGSGIIPSGQVSDNCINFTDKNTANTSTGAASAKWSGVSFLCDTANSLREVVGTGSTEGINTVSATGASGATHRFFFVYNDQSAQLDFDTLTDILASFKTL